MGMRAGRPRSGQVSGVSFGARHYGNAGGTPALRWRRERLLCLRDSVA
jgi:hypothetical protein